MQCNMPIKKDSKTTQTKKNTKNDKKVIKKIEKKSEKKRKIDLISQKNIKLANEDKMLEKVEKYVDKNREKTSQEMVERKRKRPAKKFQEWDLELLISRVSIENSTADKNKTRNKWILYIIYIMIIIILLILMINFFFE